MDSTYSLADIAAATGGNRNNDGFGDGNGWWIILFFLCMFGWGGFGGWGGGFGSNGGSAATQADIQRGFDNQAVVTKLDGITQGICSLGYDQLAQMNGINQNISQTGFGIQQAINADTVAGMQNTNALATQLANCCCENKQGQADIKYQMATDTCAIQNTTRDIVDNANANTRSILDFLVNDKISALTAENQSLKFQASQTAQNAYLAAMSDAQTAELIRRINPAPVPAYSVPAPFPYGGGNGCGFSNNCC